MKQDIICPGPLTEEALTQAVEAFLMEVRPGRERLCDYYRSQQPVPKGEAVRGRPNNLLRIPFPRYITEVHTGYFLGLPPTLDFPRAADGAAYAALRSRGYVSGDFNLCIDRDGLRVEVDGQSFLINDNGELIAP